MDKEQKNKRKGIWLILLLLLIIAGLCGYIFLSGRNQGTESETAEPAAEAMKVAEEQGEYVEPEEPMDRSKNVTLPGWGGFTIPADTTEITEGFEFHNPEENLWYEDHISIDGQELENLVVDSGNQVELNHYLKLAGIEEAVSEVIDYDKDCFRIEKSEDGSYQLEATDGFEDTKTITVKTEQGQEAELEITCEQDFYYMSFALYLEEKDELLYQSDLVSPGKYIQKMEMTRSLEAGTYDAYVVCQPYQSDQTTKTNQGVVKITLTVK